MYILLLDDDQMRHEIVERHFSKEHRVLHTFNCDEAIDVLNSCQHRIGLALLDHDLQDFVYEDHRAFERHGLYFVDKMLATVPEDKWPAQFVCHSGNPVGAQNMAVTLRRRTDAPIIRSMFCGDLMVRVANSIRAQ